MRTAGSPKNFESVGATHEWLRIGHIGVLTWSAHGAVMVTPTGSDAAVMPTRMTSAGLTLTPPCAAGLVKKSMYFDTSKSLPPFAVGSDSQPVRPEIDIGGTG